MTPRLLLSSSFPLLFAVGGCSSTSASSPGTDAGGAGASEGGTVGCAGQGDTYAANLTKPGANSVYTFTLVKALPAPPALNGNVWTVTITDENGASPSASQVVVYPFMPLMGHGSDQTPTVTANADGSFTATDVDLFMVGYWTITVKVNELADAGADASTLVPAAPLLVDQAVYSFCID